MEFYSKSNSKLLNGVPCSNAYITMVSMAAVRIHEGRKTSKESLASDQVTGHDGLGKTVAEDLVSSGQTLEIF